MKRLYRVLPLLFLPLAAFADIDFRGSFRNDAMVMKQTNGVAYADLLETKLVMERKAEEDVWKFYGDIRLYGLYGTLGTQTLTLGTNSFTTNIETYLQLYRLFLRVNTGFGSFTAGKTYLNFGVPGVFNPFDRVKSYELNNPSGDRDGSFALQYEWLPDDFLNVSCFVSPDAYWTNTAGGLALFGNLGSFDLGALALRWGKATNIVGIYFQGDVELGVNLSWAFHFDDSFENRWNEASAGIDYSFFGGDCIAQLQFYYSEHGADRTNDYSLLPLPEQYFKGRYYLYGSVAYTVDEFTSFQLYGFWNLVDYSAVVIPAVKLTLYNGLDATLMGVAVIGGGSCEFSRDTLGEYSGIFRLEAKL